MDAAKNIEKPTGQSYTQAMTKAGLGKFPIASDVSYFGASHMAAQENVAYKTRKILEKAEKDLTPSRGESQFARGIADGTYTEEDIPLTMDSQKKKTCRLLRGGYELQKIRHCRENKGKQGRQRRNG